MTPSRRDRHQRLLRGVIAAAVLALVAVPAVSCGDLLGSSPASPTAAPTEPPPAPPPPTLPPPTPEPPSPTPPPELGTGDAIVVGGEVRTRAAPSSQAQQVGTLNDHARVKVVARVTGENWLVGAQTWVPQPPAWASEWFQLEDGSYVYGPFVFIVFERETSPLASYPEDQEKWIDVNLSEQLARAMVGDQVVFTAPVSTGAPPFETPKGSFAIEPDGRIAVERMTASQAGYDPRQAQYSVERVLFTQYFDRSGDALHLNYWRPHSVFGNTPTSHGCVGMELHEAQYFWLFADAGMRVEIHD